VNLHYALNSPDAILLDQKLAYQDYLLLCKVSVVEDGAFGVGKSHSTSLALEHLIASGVEALLDDVTRVALTVVLTILVQTYRFSKIYCSHGVGLISRTYK